MDVIVINTNLLSPLILSYYWESRFRNLDQGSAKVKREERNMLVIKIFMFSTFFMSFLMLMLVLGPMATII